MKAEEVLQLVKAGFTADQIMKFENTGEIAPAANPAEASPSEEAQPEESQEASASEEADTDVAAGIDAGFDRLNKAIDDFTKKLQSASIKGAEFTSGREDNRRGFETLSPQRGLRAFICHFQQQTN